MLFRSFRSILRPKAYNNLAFQNKTKEQSTDIKLTFDPGTSLDQMLTFEVASKVWEQYLTDDVTLNLHIGVTDSKNLPKNVIGGALPGMKPKVNYGDFRARMRQDAKSDLDHTAIQYIPETSAKFKHERFYNNGQHEQDYSQSLTSSHVNMTTANAKALGLDPTSQKLDGYIALSNLDSLGIEWDTTTSATVAAGKLDLLSTALHEIGHALGFISGVDQPGAEAAVVTEVNDAIYDRVNYATTLDQFRYSSAGNRDITYGSQRSEKYFSVDGGRTALAKFSTGADQTKGGDGFQASHWKQGDVVNPDTPTSQAGSDSLIGSIVDSTLTLGSGLLNFSGSLLLGQDSHYQTLNQEGNTKASGIMNPSLSIGQRAQITELDLKAFDAIGWDLSGKAASSTIDFSALRLEAQQELAQRAGQSWQWMSENKDQAAMQLSEVRVVDIIEMAIDSQVYDLSWMNQYGGVSFFLNWANQFGGQSFWLNWWNNGGGDAWWQIIDDIFEQQGAFSTLDGILESITESEVDSLTGQALFPSNVTSIANTDSTQENKLPVLEKFDTLIGSKPGSIPSSIPDNGKASTSLQESYQKIASLSLGNLTRGGLLDGGLAGLGQDPLQGTASLGNVFATDIP